MKILVPLDGSPHSESVLPLAGRLAEHWQAEILALRVMDPTAGSLDPLISSLSEAAYQQMLDDGVNYLGNLKSHHPHLPLSTLHKIGFPQVCIEEVARQEECDLILMASQGRTGLTRWLWGSVAEGVARHSPCPAMLVHSATNPESFREILIPTDGSEMSLSVARRIGKFLSPETKVTLMHCTGPEGKAAPSELAEIQERLRQQVDGRPWMRLELAASPAPQGILDWMAGHACDLVAMSTHGRDGLAHFWNGSVMEEVARHSTCPVLAFPNTCD